MVDPPDIAVVAILLMVKVLPFGVTNPELKVNIPLAPIITAPDIVLFPPPDIVKLLYVPAIKVCEEPEAYSTVPVHVKPVVSGVALVFDVLITPELAGVNAPLRVYVLKSKVPPEDVVNVPVITIFPQVVFVPDVLL